LANLAFMGLIFLTAFSYTIPSGHYVCLSCTKEQAVVVLGSGFWLIVSPSYDFWFWRTIVVGLELIISVIYRPSTVLTINL
jgi:hypothetical protein